MDKRSDGTRKETAMVHLCIDRQGRRWIMAVSPHNKPRGCSTICLPIDQEPYEALIDSAEAFRGWLDQAYRDMPELFPEAFVSGYTLKDDRVSSKTALRLRRIKCKASGEAFTVRPSFVLPYMTGWTDDVEGPLFLRRFD